MKLTLTGLLNDIRCRGYIYHDTNTLTDLYKAQGYDVTNFEITKMLRELQFLNYITIADTNSGYRLVNPSVTISFVGCVWCGSTSYSNGICISCKFSED